MHYSILWWACDLQHTIITNMSAMIRTYLVVLVLAHNIWGLSSLVETNEGSTYVKSAISQPSLHESEDSRGSGSCGEAPQQERVPSRDKFLPCLLRRCRPVLISEHADMRQVSMITISENVTACDICGAVPMHRCTTCGRSTISHGVTSQDKEKR
jgi:hypothetical protein